MIDFNVAPEVLLLLFGKASPLHATHSIWFSLGVFEEHHTGPNRNQSVQFFGRIYWVVKCLTLFHADCGGGMCPWRPRQHLRDVAASRTGPEHQD